MISTIALKNVDCSSQISCWCLSVQVFAVKVQKIIPRLRSYSWIWSVMKLFGSWNILLKLNFIPIGGWGPQGHRRDLCQPGTCPCREQARTPPRQGRAPTHLRAADDRPAHRRRQQGWRSAPASENSEGWSLIRSSFWWPRALIDLKLAPSVLSKP